MVGTNIYDFLQSVSESEVNASVDAVTVTATGWVGKWAIEMAINEMRESLEVEQKKPFTFNGARGWVRGSVRYAEKVTMAKKEWCILMVTGKESQVWYDFLIKLKGDVKFTRLDLCCDILLRSVCEDVADILYRVARKPDRCRLVKSSTGSTFYCGKRDSEVMVRVYDKSAEYGEQKGSVWRWEVQLLRESAATAAQSLGEGWTIEDLLWGFIAKEDVQTPTKGVLPKIVREVVTASNNEMKLNWLRSQVRNTVKHLVSVGLAKEAGEALGVKQLEMEGFD